jgi:drug/metabolite transporter (DMT)-like permease
MAILTTRNAISALILFLFMFIYDRNLLKCRVRDLPILLGGGFIGMTLTNVFYNLAVLNLSLGFAGVLIGLSPVYVVFIAAFLFRERVTTRKLLGMVLAVIGVVMVSGVIDNGITFTALGLASGLLSGLFYGMTSIFTKIAIGRQYNGLTITFYAVLITAITTAPFANWETVASYTAAAPVSHMLLMIAHAVIGAALPYLMLNVSLKHIEAGKASILTSSEPVSAMLFGAFVYGEKLTIISVAGMVIAVTAFGIISTGKHEE